MALYSVMPDRKFRERLNYDLLFRWLLDMTSRTRPSTLQLQTERETTDRAQVGGLVFYELWNWRARYWVPNNTSWSIANPRSPCASMNNATAIVRAFGAQLMQWSLTIFEPTGYPSPDKPVIGPEPNLTDSRLPFSCGPLNCRESRAQLPRLGTVFRQRDKGEGGDIAVDNPATLTRPNIARRFTPRASLILG